MRSDRCVNLASSFSLVGDQLPRKLRAWEAPLEYYIVLFSERWQETQCPWHNECWLPTAKKVSGDGTGPGQVYGTSLWRVALSRGSWQTQMCSQPNANVIPSNTSSGVFGERLPLKWGSCQSGLKSAPERRQSIQSSQKIWHKMTHDRG